MIAYAMMNHEAKLLLMVVPFTRSSKSEQVIGTINSWVHLMIGSLNKYILRY